MGPREGQRMSADETSGTAAPERATEMGPAEERVLCGAMAAYCRCAKDAGHVESGDEIHACNPAECTGEWSGTYDASKWDGGRDWQALALPRRVARS